MSTGPSSITQLIGDAPLARWSQRFTHGSASVTLRADRTELIDSAVATLYAYQRTTTTASRWTITLRTGVPINHARAEVLFADGTEHDIGPRLTARSLTLPTGRAFWIRDRATVVHLDHDTSTITAHCRELDDGGYWAARLVRQVMTAQLLHHGAIYAHTAALIHHGVDVLIAGHKGTGKTTTLLSVLRWLGGDFVTNDRLLLSRDRDGATVTGYAWPMPLRVAAGTLHAMPGLHTLPPNPVPPSPSDLPTGPPTKIEIEPDELRRWLPDTTITGTLRPRLMLWPYRTTAPALPERIPTSQIRDTLVRTQLFMHDPRRGTSSHRNHWLLDPGDPHRATAALADVADLVARTVPCFRVPVTDDPAALAHQVAGLSHTTGDLP